MNAEFDKYLKEQEAQMEAPMPPCYKHPVNGRVFRTTAKLHKFAKKMKLIPVHEVPDELKTTKEKNLEAAQAKADAKAAEVDADTSSTGNAEAEAVAKSTEKARPGRRPASPSA